MVCARGGTEILYDELMQRLPPAYIEGVQLVVSALSSKDRLESDRPTIFWAHQSYDQPSVQNLRDVHVQDLIDVFVFVSEWQKAQYVQHLGIPPERSVVIRNAIRPILPHTKPQEGKFTLIYTSTPFRGLDVLLDAFAQLHRDDVELHIYSGMQLYGRAQEDVRFAALYERARQLPNVYYHGVVSNDEVRQALMQAHIFAYPSTWEETSCLAAIEAMAAGCVAVMPRLGALPETGGAYARLYDYVPDKSVHAQRFVHELNSVIDAYKRMDMAQQIAHYNHAYSWDVRIREWIDLYERLIRQRVGSGVSSGARNIFTLRT